MFKNDAITRNAKEQLISIKFKIASIYTLPEITALIKP
ncbi:hypothetical protein ADICYQ_5518 [Cyclobacterium qasimii M12-11B]|uniref:Uncharacterized protein n=1 Tax=Cyclobacterium qasimii M12-11B TaxID=641524 RepID=S7V7M6_9BACT|nr:hypothetical protein ADICYQ_5518 [Cyclobacterium qasimii M12-11B]